MKKLEPSDIGRLALAKKCVSIPHISCAKMPAAFLQNMQFSIVMRYIGYGVYEYRPKKKVKAPWPGEMIKSDF
jgi:hypothetical protein